MEQLGKLVKEDRINDIDDIRDESAPRLGEPVRIVVYLKKNADPHLVMNQLYEYTRLQKTVSIILLALVEGRPKVLSIKEMMQEFLKHRVQVIRRRTEFLLREAKRRGHILEGQLIAISSLDEVIRICRNSPDRTDAKRQLIAMSVAATLLNRAIGDAPFQALQRELGVAEVYHMTEQQAEAVVRLQLGQLAALERDEIFKEYSGLREQIISYEQLLSDDANIFTVIKHDLEDIRDKFGDARKTEISDEGGDIDLEALIPEEDMLVSISHAGYLKRLPPKTFRTQHRGGKGVQGGAREDDFIEHFFTASTHAYLLCFTNLGQCHWLKVYNIPEASRTSAGRSIANVLALKQDEKLESVIPVRHFVENQYLMMATKNGLVKKTELTEYSRPRAGGVIGINLEEGDSLIDVALVKPGDEVILSTRSGMAIRFSESDARPMGRNTKGVKGINLGKGDELVGMVVADPNGCLLTVCENGYGKRTPFGANTPNDIPDEVPEVAEPIDEAPVEGDEAEERSGMRYRKQRRGGKGLKDIKASDRNGSVVGIMPVQDTDDVMIITLQGMVTRIKASEIRVVGRNTQGVRVISPNEGDKVANIAKVVREEEVETPADQPIVAPPAVEPPPSA
jgi:DNA gyrase subunit A